MLSMDPYKTKQFAGSCLQKKINDDMLFILLIIIQMNLFICTVFLFISFTAEWNLYYFIIEVFISIINVFWNKEIVF